MHCSIWYHSQSIVGAQGRLKICWLIAKARKASENYSQDTMRISRVRPMIIFVIGMRAVVADDVAVGLE